MFLENELATLRAELEHERSLREIDQRRAAQTKARLERQVQFATEEAEEAKNLLEELRTTSEDHAKSLREGRQETLSDLRACQAQLAEMMEQQGDGYQIKAAQEKIVQLEGQLEASKEEIISTRQRLREVIEDEDQRRRAVPPEPVKDETDLLTGQASAAPKAVMRELNAVRIALAESERKYRQLHRKSDEWSKKALQVVQLKEISEAAKFRNTKLELDLKGLQRELENQRATHARWADFVKEIGLVLNLTLSGPPEAATVLRHLQKQQQQVKMMEAESNSLRRSLADSNDTIASLEKATREATMTTKRSQRDLKNAQQELDQAKLKLQVMHAQEHIWQREADGLRAIVMSFDDVHTSQSGLSENAATKSIEAALNAAKEEISLLKKECERLTAELESASAARQVLEKELDRVTDKFEKLRDALIAERRKAESAEDRAVKAETLAGKGLMNPEITRTLHLEKNPLSDAIRDRYQREINGLKARLEGIAGEKPILQGTPMKPDVDPEKLHQRLKDTFKEQIGIFREGVYLITGYKIDMLLEKSTPYFKVRSVYGEREEDMLVFNWPKGVKQPKSLELRANDFARILSATDSYQYLTKYDSMPGFMASTQLGLLEKCTFASNTPDE
jgi:hypothetical protein